MSTSSSQANQRCIRDRRYKMSRVFPRVRTGCLTCRQRKKKCGEEKPRCLACARNKLDCSWPAHIARRLRLGSADQQIRCDEQDQELSRSDYSPTEAAPSPVFETPLSSENAMCDRDTYPDITDDFSVAWSWGLNAFISPRRAGMLLPVSQLLLSHYLERTAPLLSTTPAPNAPYVYWVMPIAYNDDLLMHSILALSGAHMSFVSRDNIEVEQATYEHYCLAIRTLRCISGDESLLAEPAVLIKVVLTMVILCHYEAIAGNSDGSLFTHLRASRHLVLKLRNKCQEIETEGERKLYGFVMEVYSYIVLSNSITPFGMNHNRTLFHDSFLRALDDLKDFGAFGVMFAGGHSLFEMISLISLFAAQQDSLSSPSDELDPERLRTYKRLKTSALNWNPPATESLDFASLSERRAALEICRHALLIFLETALSCFTKHDMTRMHQLQPLIDVAISYLPQAMVSSYSCLLMWPLMIIGSCSVKEEQRSILKDTLIHNRYMMRHTIQASWLLELLWADCDEYAVGPYGLGLLMEKHGFDYGIV